MFNVAQKAFSIITLIALTAFLVISLTGCGSIMKLFGGQENCEHSYTEAVVPPTCSEEGYTEHICTKCDDSYKDTFTQKVAHSYTDIVVNPTCTAEGYTTHTCTQCGNSYVDSTVAKVAHSYLSVVTAPTCTAEGYTTHTCTECDDSYTDSTVAKVAHRYSSVVTSPTCTAEGYTTHTCDECGNSYKDGRTQKTSHPYKDVVVSPTCTAEGYTEHICEVCGENYKDSAVSKIPHTYLSEVTSPTCISTGYTTHTCSVCGDTYADSETEMTSHRFNASACLYCSMNEITEGITPDTDWYNSDYVSMTLKTKEQLAGLAVLVSGGVTFTGQIVYLGADIDLGYHEWTPIGNAEYAFAGTFDGDGYTISGLKINASYSYVGLFGKATGILSDFTVDGASVYVADTYDYVSVICGYSSNEISNVNAAGFIDAEHSNYIGAICGTATVGIGNCSAKAEINAGNYAGGIVGYSDVSSAVYSHLSYSGTVNGGDYIGGIIGNINATGTIQTDLLNFEGVVKGSKYVGGTVGYVKAAVGSRLHGATVTADITGGCYVGGIAGEASSVAISGSSNDGSTISATSYETIDSTMYAYLGGYVGKGYSVDGAINNADVNYALRGLCVGGIAGYLSNNATNCENNGNVSGYDYVGGIAGHLSSTTTNPVTNLKNSGNISGNSIVGGVFGRYGNSSNTNLLNLENSGNISATGNQGGGIAGVANASGKTLIAESLKNTGAVIVTDYRAGGLFGYVEGNTSSVIENSESSAEIFGKYYVGGLVGQALNVSVASCSNEGSTIAATGWYSESSVDYVWLGGYVGRGYKVSGCINNADINYFGNGRYIGGIVGYAIDSVTDCTNNGHITTISDYVGGIVGYVETTAVTVYFDNLINNGNISGNSRVAGLIGAILERISTRGSWDLDKVKNSYRGTYYHYYCNTISMNNSSNTGNVTAAGGQVAGLIGAAELSSSYTSSHTNCSGVYSYGCDIISDVKFIGSSLSNSGEIAGKINVGEFFGYFSSDGSSTITTYTVTGKITLNGEVKDGTYDVGTKTNLTLNGRTVYVPPVEEPETDGSETSGEESTDGADTAGGEATEA
ncbi:MAG: hypothetical protein E7617_08185 [Ruminococcaceae bacterium]|nr:hypothetical protein [Oscillospiraceae bacterium]